MKGEDSAGAKGQPPRRSNTLLCTLGLQGLVCLNIVQPVTISKIDCELLGVEHTYWWGGRGARQAPIKHRLQSSRLLPPRERYHLCSRRTLAVCLV